MRPQVLARPACLIQQLVLGEAHVCGEPGDCRGLLLAIQQAPIALDSVVSLPDQLRIYAVLGPALRATVCAAAEAPLLGVAMDARATGAGATDGV